jgi:hypothetical protein
MPEINKLEDLTDNVKQYLLLNIAIFKLESTKQASTIGASIVSALVVGMAAFLVVFTVGIGLGFYFSALLGDTYSGFAIMAGFYLIVAIVIYVGRKKIIEKPIRNKIIEKILQNPKP